MKKHQALLTEVAGHEPRIHSVCEQGSEMIESGHYASDDIKSKIEELNDKWSQLTVRTLKKSASHCSSILFSTDVAKFVGQGVEAEGGFGGLAPGATILRRRQRRRELDAREGAHRLQHRLRQGRRQRRGKELNHFS